MFPKFNKYKKLIRRTLKKSEQFPFKFSYSQNTEFKKLPEDSKESSNKNLLVRQVRYNPQEYLAKRYNFQKQENEKAEQGALEKKLFKPILAGSHPETIFRIRKDLAEAIDVRSCPNKQTVDVWKFLVNHIKKPKVSLVPQKEEEIETQPEETEEPKQTIQPEERSIEINSLDKRIMEKFRVSNSICLANRYYCESFPQLKKY